MVIFSVFEIPLWYDPQYEKQDDIGPRWDWCFYRTWLWLDMISFNANLSSCPL